MPRRTIANMRQARADAQHLSDSQKQEIDRWIDQKEADDYNLATRMLAERTWRDVQEADGLHEQLSEAREVARLLVERADEGALSYEDAVTVYEDLRRVQSEASARSAALVQRHERAHQALQDPVAYMDGLRQKWGEQHYSPV